VKKPPSKTDLREKLVAQTAAFLSAGGTVRQFSAGESAYDRDTPAPPTPLFEARSGSRTPLTDVIAALDARRANKKRQRTRVVRRRSPKRRKQTLYDDFGEPLRVIWVEE